MKLNTKRKTFFIKTIVHILMRTIVTLQLLLRLRNAIGIK